jgi:hypothetical protein
VPVLCFLNLMKRGCLPVSKFHSSIPCFLNVIKRGCLTILFSFLPVLCFLNVLKCGCRTVSKSHSCLCQQHAFFPPRLHAASTARTGALWLERGCAALVRMGDDAGRTWLCRHTSFDHVQALITYTSFDHIYSLWPCAG